MSGASPPELLAALAASWSERTTDDWRPERPERHQCGVSALVIQDYLGGDICRNRIIERHVWFNRLPGGQEIFITDDYAGQPRAFAQDKLVPRGLIFLHPGNMPRRYQILAASVADILSLARERKP